MTDDILNASQNPDELRRLAQVTAQAREYEQHLLNLNTAMQAEKNAYEQRIREPEEALKLAQQWHFSRNPVKEKTGKKPAHLPRQETVFMPEIGCTCQDCGSTMRYICDGVNEVPESVPAHVVVKRTVRPQYRCPCCDTVHSAVLSPAVIDKGQPGPGLLARWCIS